MDRAAETGNAPGKPRKRGRWWKWTAAILVAWIVGTIAGIIPGFIVPPAIMEGGDKTLEVDADHYPPGTELVEIPLASGERLRGVFVRSDFGAPVVLHLLDSSGSVVSKLPHSWPVVLADLADAGFASLMVDYRGVGASDGSRSPTHLEEDARAMWDEAVRRAGGDPGLVVVRAASIGCLAAASLAEHDVRAAAWILIAPVRGETVVRHFAQWQYPGILSRVATTFFRPASSAHLVEDVARMCPRLWVDSLEGDELLPADEQSELRAAVLRAGGSWGRGNGESAPTTSKVRLRPRPESQMTQSFSITFVPIHVLGTGDRHRLLQEERDLLGSIFPQWPDHEAIVLDVLSKLPREVAAPFAEGTGARDRLRNLAPMSRRLPPLELALVATRLEDVRIADWILRKEMRGEHPWLEGLDPADMTRVLDLADPSGRLPESLLLDWVLAFYWIRSAQPDAACALDPDHILPLVRSSEIEAAEGWDQMHNTPTLTGWTGRAYPCCDLWRTLLEERGLSRPNARRQATRILLKSAGIPDRIVLEADGSTKLEIRTNGEWKRMDLDWPEPTQTSNVAGASAQTSR